ncbi:MAG: hypothetical protein UHY90_01895 [Treponema sp.]|nr:hypothetical protein [Spirochaetia bacterium]MDD7460194.1 hypothetical protein [Spirochaetales bacterium]MDY5810745.1 hypothetical protein [Treponema sp.]MEE1180977.1 hypothetical protein [Treponema sp.]
MAQINTAIMEENKEAQAVPEKTVEYTIDLLISMTVEILARDLHRDTNQVLQDFLLSKTGRGLYDADTKLWCNGPAYIAEIYRDEVKNRK